jgi:DnaJ-class molecular chaperone
VDYYNILGVAKNASDKDIRHAYRRLAREHHPDLNPGVKEAERKFKRINEAHQVLSNPDSRKKYDRYGDKWKQADRMQAEHGDVAGSPFGWSSRRGGRADPFAGIDDLLGGYANSFGRRGRTAAATRVEGAVDVSLEEAFAGAKRNVTISSGRGDRRIEVTIPPGVNTGSVVRITLKEGQELLLNVTVSPHRRLSRKGDDLFAEVEVPLEDAILGGEVEVRTLKSKVRLKVPPESQNGQRIRLAGQGMPRLGSAGRRGDLYVSVRPTMPKGLSSEERELVQKLKELRSRKR